ncbi:MAG: lipopolysaccharide transport periplasmic protein LptA [Pseudomonadota bacterium]
MIQVRNILCYCLLLLATTVCLALPEDSGKNMHIVADSTLFNYKTGFNTYEGNVKVLQGETHLTADLVTTQANDHHKIQEAIAYGKNGLAHYWTLPQKGDPLFHAHAKIIKFYPLTSLVVLQGEVVVTQGNNSFNGPEIIYNIKDQTVTSPANKNGRATIIIDPTKLTT